MNIEQYLSSYERYRDTVQGLGKAIEKLRESRTSNQKSANKVEIGTLESQYLKKKRILDYATRKLQCAISRIKDPKLTNYLVCRYFCCMRNEDIAESFNYCERQIYRIASRAKKRLEIAIRINAPSPSRRKHRKKYLFSARSTHEALRKYRRVKRHGIAEEWL